MEEEQYNVWVVFLGGDAPRTLPPCLQNKSYQSMICADSGANHAFALRLVPDIIIGDLDSIDQAVKEEYVLKGVEILQFPQEKDYTDGELAVMEAAKRGAKELLILGAFGGRIDQELANIYLLAQYALLFDKMTLWGEGFTAILVQPGKELRIRGQKGDTVSLIPLSPVAEKVTLEGFQYPLKNDDLPIGATRGLSNRLLSGEGIVRYAAGSLLLIQYWSLGITDGDC